MVRSLNRPSPRATISLEFSVRGKPHPIRHYTEQKLETTVVCDSCTLRYAVYGVFAFCPDCRVHNSLQILNKNLDLYIKVINIAKQMEPAVAENLTSNALEDAVSAFDGFGRESCRLRASASKAPSHSANVSFQKLPGARKKVLDLFSVDMAEAVSPEEWSFAFRCFQKRHLHAHSMEVVDDVYIQATNDPTVTLGRKIAITPDDVVSLIAVLRKLGQHLLDKLPVV